MRRKSREVTDKNDILNTCWRLSAVRIYRIPLGTITGKRNLPGSE